MTKQQLIDLCTPLWASRGLTANDVYSITFEPTEIIVEYLVRGHVGQLLYDPTTDDVSKALSYFAYREDECPESSTAGPDPVAPSDDIPQGSRP